MKTATHLMARARRCAWPASRLRIADRSGPCCAMAELISDFLKALVLDHGLCFVTT